MTIRHIHLSGRFNASAAALETSLDKHGQDADVMTLTEVAAPARAQAVKEKGWIAVHAPAGTRAADCALTFRESKFKVLSQQFPMISDATYKNKRGFETRPIRAVMACVEDTSGHVGVWATAHLPSGVRTAKGFRKTTSQYRAYVQNVRALRKEVNLFVDELEGDGIRVDYIVISCDWNIDIKRGWARAFLKSRFVSYKANWHKPYPKRGTLGKAIIDIALLKGIKVKKGPTVLPNDGSSDHNPFKEILEVT